VSQDDRHLADPVTVADVEVGVADPRRGEPDEHLARSRFVDPKVLDRDGLTGGRQDGGTHPAIMASADRLGGVVSRP
jgi:hypothetical protein